MTHERLHVSLWVCASVVRGVPLSVMCVCICVSVVSGYGVSVPVCVHVCVWYVCDMCMLPAGVC